MDAPNPYTNNCAYFSIPPYRQFGAGPVNCSMETMTAMLFQPVTPVNTHFFQMLDDIQSMTRYVFQTKNEVTFVSQTSGNGGNELLVTNLADPGETVIVAKAGVWGYKVADMTRRYGLNVIDLSKPPGEIYALGELEEAIVKHKPVALFVTHGESSGGTLQNLDGLGKMCHRHNCLLAVDAVVSVGVVPFYMDRWEVDAVTGGSQKGIGAPAGLCLVSLSDRAYKKVLNKKHPVPYIYDVQELAKVWKCMGNMRTYHYTYGSPLIAALRQALIEICKEGLVNVWNRHKEASERFVSKLQEIGVEHFVQKPENRFWGVNIVRLPKGIGYPEVVSRLLDEHMMEVSYGIGPSADPAENRNLRIGFMASNAQPEFVDNVVAALKETINHCIKNKNAVSDSVCKIQLK